MLALEFLEGCKNHQARNMSGCKITNASVIFCFSGMLGKFEYRNQKAGWKNVVVLGFWTAWTFQSLQSSTTTSGLQLYLELIYWRHEECQDGTLLPPSSPKHQLYCFLSFSPMLIFFKNFQSCASKNIALLIADLSSITDLQCLDHRSRWAGLCFLMSELPPWGLLITFFFLRSCRRGEETTEWRKQGDPCTADPWVQLTLQQGEQWAHLFDLQVHEIYN